MYFLFKNYLLVEVIYCCHIHKSVQCLGWLVLLAATWKCLVSCRNGYAGLLVLLLLSLLNLWAYHRNIASLSFFYMYQGSYELAELLPLPHSRGRSTRYSNRMHNFSITISSCYKDVYVNSFFPRNTRSLNFTRLI